MQRRELPGHDIVAVRADNPGPLTLDGTNSWIVGSGPAWLVDPGPDLAEHVKAVSAELQRRGGLAGIALTHDHHDHSGAVPAIRGRFPHAPLAAARGEVDRRLADGDRLGPFSVLALPGHAPDHLVYLAGDVAFTGDAVLGTGSVFIAPDPGALAAYLDGLRRLQARAPAALCPGHGPIVADGGADAKLQEYLDHRADRERRLLDALQAGRRSVEELLDGAWSEVPEVLRPAAAVVLAAHLDKLEGEGRLPPGVERPDVSGLSEPHG